MRLMKKNAFSQKDLISTERSTKSTSNILKLKNKSYNILQDLSSQSFMENPILKFKNSNLLSLKHNSPSKLSEMNSDNSIQIQHSKLMKKLEIWDKEHLSMEKENPDSLYKRLSSLYKKINLEKEQKKLDQLNFLLKSKSNLNQIMDKGNKSNKILVDFFNKRNKDQGSILRNNIIKTKTRFNFTLFSPKNTKEIEINFGVNSETIKAMNAREINSEYYSKVIKDKIKYENQLHQELISVNNDIYEKKIEKKEKNTQLSEIYNKQSKLTKKFNILFNKRKSALEKFQESFEIEQNKYKKDKKFKNFQLNNFLKSVKVKAKNDKLQNNILQTRNKYIENMNKIKEKKEQCINDLKRIEEEMSYYKQVNNELIKEHRNYYMDILKNGFDSRNEGMIWCVRNLLELQTNLDYHHFPKFLSHEEIDYLIKIATISLEEIQLKIILKVLKKKQKELKDKENMRRISQVDYLISKKNNCNNNEKENIFKHKRNLTDYELEKLRINKKFIKLYSRNDETMRMFSYKSHDENKDEEIIEKLKKNLFNKNNFNNDEEGELLKLFQGDMKQQNVLSLIILIRERMEYLSNLRQSIIQEQIKIYKERTDIDESNLNINQLMERELIKKCLFGSNFNI